MTKRPPDLLIFGEGAVAAALKTILKVPVISRRSDDIGWDWLETEVADLCRGIFVASSRTGADRIVRHQADAWSVPGASRLAIVLVVPEQSVAQGLLARDVFGRLQEAGATFADYSDTIRLVEHPITLLGVLDALMTVVPLPKDTWHREAKDASCLPLLLDAILRQSVAELERAIPLARNVHWDSICHPTAAFPNHHQYANAIKLWLDSVTLGVTPDWRTGFNLIEPLAHR